MYADDTTLHFIGNNVDEVVDGLNQALCKILLWCRNNKLTIHAGKSEAMIICDLPQENIQQELIVQTGKTKRETNGKQTLRESVLTF